MGLLLGKPNSSGGQDLKACTGRPSPPGGSVYPCGEALRGPSRGRQRPDLVRQCRRAQENVLASDQAWSVQYPAYA
ncbi:mCG1035719, isoform CRA_b [Mus musculus]|nr:mCG1035719, isoform CRA_b [Mus musculus]